MSTEPQKKKRALVIGAGASGLVMLKELLSTGAFDVVAFEAEDAVGGLWRFTEKEAHSSVYRTTVINTSKEMMSFSDFLIPKEFPLFLHNTQVVQYFDSYVAHFGLGPHIRFGTRVTQLAPAADYATTGRWSVTTTTATTTTTTTTTEVFDYVAVCSGHHWRAKSPSNTPGQDRFQGPIVHSHAYKDHQGYEGKNVVVVGVGNSGLDIAVELSRHAKQVYLCSRRGAWIVNRIINGKPLDMNPGRVRYLFPRQMVLDEGQRVAASLYDLSKYNLLPSFKFYQAHPSINGEIVGRIVVGAVKVVPAGIKEIRAQSVVYEDGSDLPADAIIYATGYSIGFPFLSPSAGISFEHNEAPLYEHVFPFGTLHPSTLAFIGLFQPLGAIMPISEVQARWVAMVWQGAKHLPDPERMRAEYEQARREQAQRYVSSERHTIQVDYPDYPDRIAKKAGFYPDLWTTFFTDRALWHELMFSPAIPAHWRVNGPGAWSGARQAILEMEDRVAFPTTGKAAKDLVKQQQGSGSSTLRKIVLLAVCVVGLYYARQKIVL